MPEKIESKQTPANARTPKNNHGMDQYEEIFRRTDNPYRRINPHWPEWPDEENKNKSRP